MTGDGYPSPRYAVVPPYVAAWLRTEMGGGPSLAARARAHALALRRMGRPDLAEQVEGAYEQLRDAAAHHRDQQDALVEGPPAGHVRPAALISASASDIGRGAAEVVAVEAPSAVTVRAAISTGEAGAELGVSARTVTSWLNDGTLSGQKVGGAWVVDSGSVEALAAVRSS